MLKQMQDFFNSAEFKTMEVEAAYAQHEVKMIAEQQAKKHGSFGINPAYDRRNIKQQEEK